MERVFEDDDVSGSCLSSRQLDCEPVGLAPRVDHHHLSIRMGSWKVRLEIECTSERDGWRRGRNLARNSDLRYFWWATAQKPAPIPGSSTSPSINTTASPVERVQVGLIVSLSMTNIEQLENLSLFRDHISWYLALEGHFWIFPPHLHLFHNADKVGTRVLSKHKKWDMQNNLFVIWNPCLQHDVLL